MSINIRQAEAIKLKTKEALFVNFPYSTEHLEKIKSLPVRYWIKEQKEWEVPIANISMLLDVFKEDEIKITGKVTTKVKKAAQAKKFEMIDGTMYNFKTVPFQHQIEGFEYGMANSCFLLGDDQGLGKTKQVIDIACARKGQFKHCLIVTGVNALKWNWLDEIKIHSNETGHLLGGRTKKGKLHEGSIKERLQDLLNIDKIDDYFIVTNVETLRDANIQETLQELCTSGVIGMTCIDEIHKAKNAQSAQGKAIHKLQSFYKIAATGTPLMNSPLDLYNILKWIGVERHSFSSFRSRYAIMGGFGGYQVVDYKNLGELRNILMGCQLRRLKGDVLDLPEKTHSTEYVEMGKPQAKIYKEMLSLILEDIDMIKADPNPLSQLIRLRQATGYTGILSSEVTESAKIDRMIDLLEEKFESGEKVIVFSNWTSTLNPAIERFKKEFTWDYAKVTGEVKDRMAEKDKFQNDPNCKVFFGTIGAAGTGLTLTAGTTVIFLDEPWNDANKRQAEDRAHRIGTTGTVSIITLVTKDTIDERVAEIVQQKGEYSDMLVDGKVVTPDRGKLVDYLLS